MQVKVVPGLLRIAALSYITDRRIVFCIDKKENNINMFSYYNAIKVNFFEEISHSFYGFDIKSIEKEGCLFYDLFLPDSILADENQEKIRLSNYTEVKKRFEKIKFDLCSIENKEMKSILNTSIKRLRLTATQLYMIERTARAIAALDDRMFVSESHLAEAISYQVRPHSETNNVIEAPGFEWNLNTFYN